MKKRFFLGLALLTGGLLLNSCDPWEDESYHPGDNNGGGGQGEGLLLKEIKRTGGGIESVTTFTYDSNNRIQSLHAVMTTMGEEQITEGTYTYSGQYNSTVVLNQLVGNQIVSTTTIHTTVNGNTVNKVTEIESQGQTISTSTHQISFSAPCGIQSNTVSETTQGNPPTNYVLTYEYLDSNCSVKEFRDGVLTVTITKDDKLNPLTTPENYAMGINLHNATKYEYADGTVENITYTYNSSNYPTKAVHSFPDAPQNNYTEEFTYY